MCTTDKKDEIVDEILLKVMSESDNNINSQELVELLCESLKTEKVRDVESDYHKYQANRHINNIIRILEKRNVDLHKFVREIIELTNEHALMNKFMNAILFTLRRTYTLIHDRVLHKISLLELKMKEGNLSGEELLELKEVVVELNEITQRMSEVNLYADMYKQVENTIQPWTMDINIEIDKQLFNYMESLTSDMFKVQMPLHPYIVNIE